MSTVTAPYTHRLLAELMRRLLKHDQASANELLGANRPEIDNLCALLDKSRLAGYFHTLVRDTPITGFFSGEQLAALASRYQRQVERNEANIALLLGIRQLLAAESIPFLTIKGFYLAQRFFGSVHARFMWDIDILVHSPQLEAVIASAETLGLYASPGALFGTRSPLWDIHAVEVRSSAGKLDIHHAIRRLPGIRFDYDRMWSQSQAFSLGGTQFSTLSDTDTLLVAAVGLGADIQKSHHNLRKIWDIYQILAQLDACTDWDAFIAERRSEGSLKLVLNVFSFCLLLTGAKDDCPRLDTAMYRHRHLLLINTEQQAATIFTRKRQHIANRMLFARLLPVSPLYYWLRWLFTLPVRLWHYRRAMSRGKRNR